MIVFDGFKLIIIGLVVLAMIIGYSIKGFRAWNAWRKTGFCKHEWKLVRTNSYGSRHWCKCDKCNTERLM